MLTYSSNDLKTLAEENENSIPTTTKTVFYVFRVGWTNVPSEGSKALAFKSFHSQYGLLTSECGVVFKGCNLMLQNCGCDNSDLKTC